MTTTDIDKASKPELQITTSTLNAKNYWDHFLARWAVNRGGHRVEPGLYALGNPKPDSPVFVSANYTLSFDALRFALKDIDGFILVLDTKGINVWCAAGKGTFGTDELVNRIQVTRLQEVVNHRNLILPQLGAPGVSGFEVTKRTHFKVEYGPGRAQDLPEYLKTHTATPEMRRVQFTLMDRLTLIPVELVSVLLPLLILFLIGWKGPAAAILAGTVLFPILLPWIPTHNFSTKGFILGAAVALPFAIAAFMKDPGSALWVRSAWALVFVLLIPSITAYLALNFTGSTTFTSRSGVQREMFAYIPTMAWMFGAGLLLNIGIIFVR
jgi:CO dehydrogenase/acetyl-CoA synthase delta subunit